MVQSGGGILTALWSYWRFLRGYFISDGLPCIRITVKGEASRMCRLPGPFAYWKHVHSFEPLSEDVCVLQDRIEYRLPLGIVGRLVAGWWIRRKLERLFGVSPRYDGTRGRRETTDRRAR